jgi:hypothetical protein
MFEFLRLNLHVPSIEVDGLFAVFRGAERPQVAQRNEIKKRATPFLVASEVSHLIGSI